MVKFGDEFTSGFFEYWDLALKLKLDETNIEL